MIYLTTWRLSIWNKAFYKNDVTYHNEVTSVHPFSLLRDRQIDALKDPQEEWILLWFHSIDDPDSLAYYQECLDRNGGELL